VIRYGRVAFVFARAGSKGVPGKNLRTVGGVSLLARAIRCARACPGIDEVVVSTDSDEIASAATVEGALVPGLRPSELAADDSSELEAWRHAIDWFAVGDGWSFDTFISVPPTAPLRRVEDLGRCLAAFDSGGWDLILSGSSARRHPAFNMVEVDSTGAVHLLAESVRPATRRQDMAPCYDLTTVAYVSSPRHVASTASVLSGRVGLVEVPPAYAIDVDEELDLVIADLLLGYLESTRGGIAS
jgi:CMP-N-acetylneuraminic acid synthetase